MKIFEFYFSPKKQPHTRYESFCYEPENAAEKRLGHLCATGELTNILPTNARLLQDLATVIRDAYYNPSHPDSAAAIQAAMQTANAHLASLGKKENVSWLGNLHFAITSIAGNLIHFSKAGGIKVLLSRDGQMTDIGADLENPNLASHPTHTFPNLIEGKLVLRDKIFILTKELFQFFDALGLFNAFMQLPEGKEQQKIKELLRPHEKELKEYSGIFVLLAIDKIPSAHAPERGFPRIALKAPSIPKLPIKSFGIKVPRMGVPKIKTPALAGGIPRKIPIAVRLPSFNIFNFWLLPFAADANESRKKILVLSAFIFVVALGIAFAKIQSKRVNDAAEENFLAIQQKIWQAQSLLIAQKENEANILFQESLIELEKLENSPIEDRVEKAVLEIKKELMSVNKIETIENASPIFSIDDPDLTPSILLASSDSLYILMPQQQKMYAWNTQQAESQLMDLQWSFDTAAVYDPFLIFYDRDQNSIIGGDGQLISLKIPYDGFKADSFASFMSGLYFMDASVGQIIKYPFIEGQSELLPQMWTPIPDANIRTGISLAIDGSIWILSENGQILRYWGGKWQENIQPQLWPKLSNPTKIIAKSTLPYLYILDPSEKRVIILDKQGNTIKQYISDDFDKLKDFSISPNGTTIYLLDGKEIYSLETES